jgi:hypothetical protein
MPLDRSLRLWELGEPRDLWVRELIVFEIRSRLGGVSTRRDVVADSTVGAIPSDFAGCKYANEVGLIFESDRRVAGLARVLYAVGMASQGSVRIQLFDVAVREVNVDLEAPAVGLLDSLCAEMHLDTSGSEVVDDDGSINPRSVLRNVTGIMRYVRRISTPQRVGPAGPAPPPAHIDDIKRHVDPAEPRHRYRFVYKDEAFEMDIPDRATVADAKQFVAKRFNTLAGNLTLYGKGRRMRDSLVLLEQRVHTPNSIRVCIQEGNPVLLQSRAAGRRADTAARES